MHYNFQTSYIGDGSDSYYSVNYGFESHFIGGVSDN